MTAGKTEWIIPDMFWPAADNGIYTSHEAICILNVSDAPCKVGIRFYFEDREPVECEEILCGARRTKHIRSEMMKLKDGSDAPRGMPIAAVVTCSVPAVVQYTRVDTTQEPLAMMTTIPF